MNGQRTREIAEADLRSLRLGSANGRIPRMKRARFDDIEVFRVGIRRGFDREDAPWRT